MREEMREKMVRLPRQTVASGILALAAIALGVAPAPAVDTANWEVSGPIDLMQTETERISVTARGVARLAPRLDLALEPGESYIWSLAAARDGKVYGGTGDGGLVVEVPRSGKGTTLHDSIELEILSVAVGPDGAVYAGGSPDGVILRIAGGKAETFCDLPEGYVWALAIDAKGDLYAATGDAGRLYRVNRSGEATVVYDSDEVHLLCLLPGSAGSWIVGTSGSGLVLEITAQGTARVLYDAREEEIKALARDAAGNLLIAATGSAARRDEPDMPVGGEVIEVRPSRQGSSSEDGDDERSGRRREREAPPPGRGVVYRRTPAGATIELWRATENMVLCLIPEQDGGFIAGTGDPGAIYAVDARGNGTRLLETDESQVLSLCRSEQGILFGTANPARIYRLGPAVEKTGTITAEPFDAGNVAAWGRLRYEGERPAGTAIELRTRSGNTGKPDDSWSEWSAPLTGAEGALITSPPARFVQWQATLTGSETRSPDLARVVVPYRQENLAPRIRIVEVSEPTDRLMAEPGDGPPDRVTVNMPNGVQAEFSRPRQPPKPLRRDQVPWLRDVKVVNWVADDPNGDRLEFDLFLRGEEESRWRPLAERVPDQAHAFGTAGLPDGEYRLKVIASDRRSNPDHSALDDALDSNSFLVDNTPPKVSTLRVERAGPERLRVNAEVEDELSPLRALEYSLDARIWETVFPTDGIFDSRAESFRFEIDLALAATRSRAAGLTSPVEPGRDGAGEAVLVRAADAQGNEGAARAVAP